MKPFMFIPVLLLLIAISAAPAAATEPQIEDFETSFLPDGWTSLHLGNASSWMWGWPPAHSGVHSAEIRPAWNNVLEDEWLITPAFDSTGAQHLLLDFWESGRFWTTGGGFHEVLVSTTVADDPASFTTVWQVTPGDYDAPWLDSWRDEWVKVQIDLSAFAGETVYVAFRYFSEVSEDFWWIDDVRLRAPADHEVRALAVLPNDESWLTGIEISPQLVVDNIGPYSESFPTELVIERDGTVVYSETVQVTDLASGNETTLDFPPFTCQTGDYLLQGTALLPDDGDPTDNVATAVNVCYSGQRTPLGVLYTNWACSPCVDANIAMDEWYALQGNGASLMRVHVSWPSNLDPIYQANIEQNEYLLAMCPEPVNTVPNLHLDNVFAVYSDQEIGWPTLIADSYARRAIVGSPLEMSMGFEPNDNTAHVTINVIDPMPDGNFSLFVAVTEDDIYAPGSNGEEYHNQCFRQLFPGVNGHPIATAQGTHQYTIDLDLNPDWVYENLRTIAWVQTDTSGALLNSVSLMIDGISAVDSHDGAPAVIGKLSNHPNPFNPQTTIAYEISITGPVKLSVYDLAGRLTATLVDGLMSAGRHEVAWNGRDSHGREVASGFYLSRLEASGQLRYSRMMLIR